MTAAMSTPATTAPLPIHASMIHPGSPDVVRVDALPIATFVDAERFPPPSLRR
ncbi:MAG: hypothetical protein ACRECR_01615 [Thermoplasmata archaeon]